MASSREDALLDAGIDKLPKDVLRTLLKDLCHISVTVRRETKAAIFAASTEQPAPKRLPKRKVFETCLSYGEEYDAELNHYLACGYHTGEFTPYESLMYLTTDRDDIGIKEVDWSHEMWADTDPDVHGDQRKFVEQYKYIEGTMWSCCRRPGPDTGCRRRVHISRTTQVSRK